MNPALHTSKSGDWRTPPDLFRAIQALDPRRPFTIDAAADRDSALCPIYLGQGGIAEDALAPDTQWGNENDRVWLNPPYGRQLVRFVDKALSEIVECPGLTVWLLVPARTDTKWWNALMPYASDVWFMQGRVKFFLPDGYQGDSAPFPTAVVVMSCGTGFRRGPTVRFGWRP